MKRDRDGLCLEGVFNIEQTVIRRFPMITLGKFRFLPLFGFTLDGYRERAACVYAQTGSERVTAWPRECALREHALPQTATP